MTFEVEITPDMIKKQWATPQQIAQEYETTESNVRMTCIAEKSRLSDQEKVKLGEKTWLVSRKAADRLWKKRIGLNQKE